MVPNYVKTFPKNTGRFPNYAETYPMYAETFLNYEKHLQILSDIDRDISEL